MTDEQKIQRLTDVIASLQEEINLRVRVDEVNTRVNNENAKRHEALLEERDAFSSENKRLRARIMRLECDLRLAQQMARPKRARK